MVLAELTSSSCFITLIGCAPDVARGSVPSLLPLSASDIISLEFRQSLECLYDKTLDRWREYIASTSLVHDVKLLPLSLMKCRLTSAGITPKDLRVYKAKGLSTDLLRSLIALSTSTLQLGLPRDPAKHDQVVHATFKYFVSRFLARPEPKSKEQVGFDLAILQQIVKQHGEDWDDVHQELAKRLKEVGSN